ncbi:alkyl/aryl-sulfatase [Acinetobacter pittii]|uniref:alkyl/aryl-sulfatase n=1 Tax=Acinetobacter pittii TaxID=48296 RepID=UPI00193BC135|nr:alkyl sulfatase dimerization domain-containing protein [Acinetobacter pittii]MBM0873837.1 MBL fold metallo-hydrolase [Acinetobacter pittii]
MKFSKIGLASMIFISQYALAEVNSPKDASPITKKYQEDFKKDLNFSDKQDFIDATRGLIASFPNGKIVDKAGKVVWDLKSYEFINNKEAPPTVNPSLWRQEQLNNIAGLFKVSDGIYQVRGLDLSNMTIIEGQSGLIIVDPLISSETAAAALKLYHDNISKKPIKAVIYSHSHVDHYGGVKGIVNETDVKAGKVKIYAPKGFLEHAVSENVYAGTAMSRRAQYMYGALLPKNEKGQVGAGLGKTTSRGTVGLIAPTDIIGAQNNEFESVVIDGLNIEFQLTPGTEAPAEMNMYIPKYKALGAAENATHTMHNILTIRGAEVRNPKIWSTYLDKTIQQYANKTDVLFAQHHWPTWGKQQIISLLSDQRDMYQYINDQTLRLINLGYTPVEISEQLNSLPPALAKKWYNRGYYGTMSHNVRAVYQRYMGFYDGNPANLNPLPPVEEARHYIEMMGGEKAVIQQAKKAFDRGEYRWVATLMKHVVFANPNSNEGKALLADSLEQMGYQAEAGTWRNAMLMGAQELRNGAPSPTSSTASADTIKALTVDMFFDYLGIRLNGPKAAKAEDARMNWVFTDTHENHLVTVRTGALTHRKVPEPVSDVDTTITLSRETLNNITLGQKTFNTAIQDGSIKIQGKESAVTNLFSNLDSFPVMFNIVTP